MVPIVKADDVMVHDEKTIMAVVAAAVAVKAVHQLFIFLRSRIEYYM